jgi:hypothetical protein
MNEYRTVYGYLNRPFQNKLNAQGKIEKGLIKVLYEELDGRLSPINSETDFDYREEVFLLDSFESLVDKYQKKILKINVIPNANEESEGQTKYVTFKNQIYDTNKNEVVSFIKYPIPDPLNLDVTLPHAPHTKIFYLVDDGFAYGPFLLERFGGFNLEQEASDGKLKPLTGKANGFPNLQPGYLYKINVDEIKKEFSETVLMDGDDFYLTESQKLNKIRNEQIEFATQQNVIEIFTSLANKKTISSATVRSLKSQINSIKLGAATKKAVLAVVDGAIDTDNDWRSTLFETIESDERGKLLVEGAIAEQQAKYEKKWIEDIRSRNLDMEEESLDKKGELNKLKEKLTIQERELFKVEQKIQDKMEKMAEESGFEEELKQKKLAADAELEKKKKELSDLSIKYKDLKSIDDLERKLKDLKDDIKSEQRREITLENTLSKLKQEIKLDDAVLQSKLREMVPYVSSIIQAPIPVKESKSQLTVQSLNQYTEDGLSDLAGNIVNGICTQFSKLYDREYSPTLIASILVAYHQNFMTIFSGPPGLGKTSFVRLLCKIINIGDRFKEVAVGRSWTSDREFIGFYNSLTDNFSPASSGIYQYLKAIEHDEPSSATPQIVLLDEANLSPIEYYASVLLNVADTESSKSISIGKGTINLPSSLRVIGTVNHDMTTEPLSARLLDRSPVIPFDINIDFDDANHIETDCSLEYSSKLYLDIFGSESKFSDETISNEPIQKIIDILKNTDPEWGIPFVISKRKQKSILQYLKVLTPILQTASSINFENALNKACDYATLFFLLPPISGNGNGLKLRLSALRNALAENSLTKSELKVEDMLNRGSHHLDTFNFFNY